MTDRREPISLAKRRKTIDNMRQTIREATDNPKLIAKIEEMYGIPPSPTAERGKKGLIVDMGKYRSKKPFPGK